MRATEKVTISLPTEVAAALRDTAAKEDRPVSVVVRRALERYIGLNGWTLLPGGSDSIPGGVKGRRGKR